MCSAIAASGVPALVMARGHAIQEISEVPLVISEKVEGLKRTKEAVAFLKEVKAWDDVEKVYNSKRYRAGKGKSRNRRYKKKKGPLIIYNQDNGIVKSFRNIPGVEFCQVDRLSLLKLAPGGHLGRFCIWTESAFRKLDSIYGTWKNVSATKSHWNLPMPKMTNADFTRLIRSEEIRKAVRAPKKNVRTFGLKKNPLKNARVMSRLNPYSVVLKRAAILRAQRVAAGKTTKAPAAADKKPAKTKQAPASKGKQAKPVKA
jgi:large subunit ribosomal protein L4e